MSENLDNNLPNSNIKQHKRSFLRKRLALWLVFVLICLSVLGGYTLGNKLAPKQIVVEPTDYKQQEGEKPGKVNNKEELPDYLKKDVNFSLFWQVWNKIQQQYIDRPVAETKLLYGSMSGLVNSLDDPYSVFLPPEPAKEFNDDLQGKLEGIGAEIGIRDNILTVVSPLSDSPAEKAGLKAKDRIVEIDGEETEDMSINQAVAKIRGEKGTQVKLKVFRESINDFKEINITRDVIQIESVEWEMLENNLAYIEVTNFNEDTSRRFNEAVENIILQNPKGIILDLRYNPGGYLDKAVDLASYWVDSGEVVVKEEFSDGTKNTYVSVGPTSLKDYPTVVLVNEGSASASEIVAGALQDYDLGYVMGEKTFGKGSVQMLEDLSDGSALKLTVARWLTPQDRQIDVKGIEPDQKVELTEEDWNNERDPQLKAAEDYLKNIEK